MSKRLYYIFVVYSNCNHKWFILITSFNRGVSSLILLQRALWLTPLPTIGLPSRHSFTLPERCPRKGSSFTHSFSGEGIPPGGGIRKCSSQVLANLSLSFWLRLDFFCATYVFIDLFFRCSECSFSASYSTAVLPNYLGIPWTLRCCSRDCSNCCKWPVRSNVCFRYCH